MKNFLVLGAGKMGRVCASDLLNNNPHDTVALVDIDFGRLREAADFIDSDRLHPIQRDLEDPEQRRGVFKGRDVAVCALLHKHSLPALETAVAEEVHFVDMVGEWPLERLSLDPEARHKGLTLISGMGVSPGITNVCVGRAVHLLDEVENVRLYVGGNPLIPEEPLKYRIVYAVNSLIHLYDRPASVFNKGDVMTVQALSGVEPIAFPSPFENMECFYTDGLNALIHTMKGIVRGELAEKTVRHAGHAAGVLTLKACGFFDREPVRVKGCEVIPGEVSETLLDSKLNLGEGKDATLLRVLVEGRKSGFPAVHIFEMVDVYDTARSYTSMAKTTAFPASIAAGMIASGELSRRGSFYPEQVFDAELHRPFMEELKNRGVEVRHKVE